MPNWISTNQAFNLRFDAFNINKETKKKKKHPLLFSIEAIELLEIINQVKVKTKKSSESRDNIQSIYN